VSTQIGTAFIHRDINLCVRSGGGPCRDRRIGQRQVDAAAPDAGARTAQSGWAVKVFGRPLQDCPVDDLKRTRRRWGVLFQQGALFSALSAYDNVALPLRELRALPEDVIRELVMTKLALVQIEAASADKLPSQLSGGMVKRVGG